MQPTPSTAPPGTRRKLLISLRLVALSLLASGLVAALHVDRASADTGTVTLLSPDNSGTSTITSGGSATTFGIQLSPTTAANGQTNNRANCPADSATGSTYVYTYLIPANEDVHTDNFSQGEPGFLADDPSNSDYHALALTDSFGNFETNNNDAETAPGTGQILLPVTTAYDFGTLVSVLGIPTSTLTGTNGGNWVAGYTCFKDGKVVTAVWQFPVTFTASSADAGGFTWAVTGSGSGGGTTTTTSTTTPSSTTTPTTTPDTTATTTPDTSSTTAAPTSDTSSTTAAAGSTDTTGSGTGSSGSGSGGDTSGSGSSADPGASSSSSLASTGAPVKRATSLAIALVMAGITLLLATIVLPGRVGRLARRR